MRLKERNSRSRLESWKRPLAMLWLDNGFLWRHQKDETVRWEGCFHWEKATPPSPNGNKANREKRSVTFVERYCCLYCSPLLEIKCRNSWVLIKPEELRVKPVGWLVPKRSLFLRVHRARAHSSKKVHSLGTPKSFCCRPEIICYNNWFHY